MEERLNMILLRQEKALAFIRGAVMVGVLLVATLQWYAIQQYGKVQKLEQQVAQLEKTTACAPKTFQ